MNVSTRVGADAGERITADLARQIHALSRNSKENLLLLLQDELDGGPFIGDLPEETPEEETVVRSAWKNELVLD